jgi:hypothetical protein
METIDILQGLMILAPIVFFAALLLILIRFSKANSREFRINLLSVIGGVVGVVVSFGVGADNGAGGFYITGFFYFITGSFIALVTPLGGVFQAVGIAYVTDLTYNHGWHSSSEIGMTLAVAVTAMVLVSIVFPLGPGYEHRSVGLAHRFITLSLPRTHGEKPTPD